MVGGLFLILNNKERVMPTKKPVTSKPTTPGRAVVVTTEYKGVFFGLVVDESKAPNQITLSGVRNCVYWPESVRGFLGLAVSGPTKGSKVGPAAAVSTLYKLTGVFDCSPAAIQAWNEAAWG